MPPHAAASLALEKKTLMRKQNMVVATDDKVRNSQMITGLLYFRISPYCKTKQVVHVSTIRVEQRSRAEKTIL